MKRYIYKITSPSGKVYIGQSTKDVQDKIHSYALCERYTTSKRKIVSAIKKYSWQNMKFEVIEENNSWTKEELNNREISWIAHYDSVNTGYNMTIGGDGVDSDCAKLLALAHHRNMSEEKKKIRRQNCSSGQLQRFKKNPESEATKKRKSDAHKGVYRIESPDGKIWETDVGLKEFAERYKNELTVNYWQLFNAYRKCYNNNTISRKRKDNNNWKVTRLDKPNN